MAEDFTIHGERYSDWMHGQFEFSQYNLAKVELQILGK
jgi:hypothetical protein